MDDEELIRERVRRLISMEGISQAAFAQKLGRLKSNMSAILSGERHIPKGFITEVINAYPNVRKEWLIFGEGDMFNDNEIYENIACETKPRLPNGDTENHICEYLNGTMRYACDEKPVIRQFPDYDFTIILNHDSMSPMYCKGDEVAFKKVVVADFSNGKVIDTIEWGHDYLIDTCSHGPRFKKLYEGGDYFILRSYDQAKYPDYRVRKQDVCAIYRVVGMIRV